MAKLRVVVEMNKGRIGVPLHKLGAVVKETETFFKMLSEDVELPGDKKQWLGLDFKSGSLSFVAEYVPEIKSSKVVEFGRAFDDIRRGTQVSRVRVVTRSQYAKIAEQLDEDEAIDFGIYKGIDGAAPEFLSLSKRDLPVIIGEIQGQVESFGSVQGLIHSIFIGSYPPHFFIRELSTDNLTKCVYSSAQYPQLAKALQKEASVVHVHGSIKIDMEHRRIDQMIVQQIETTEFLSDKEFEEFFGCSPNLTGQFTTQEFIDRVRGRDD